MFDHMSMPVVFALVIAFLGLLTLGILVGIRALGARERKRGIR